MNDGRPSVKWRNEITFNLEHLKMPLKFNYIISSLIFSSSTNKMHQIKTISRRLFITPQKKLVDGADFVFLIPDVSQILTE